MEYIQKEALKHSIVDHTEILCSWDDEESYTVDDLLYKIKESREQLLYVVELIDMGYFDA